MDLSNAYEDVKKGIHRDSAPRHKSLLGTLHAEKFETDCDEADLCEALRSSLAEALRRLSCVLSRLPIRFDKDFSSVTFRSAGGKKIPRSSFSTFPKRS